MRDDDLDRGDKLALWLCYGGGAWCLLMTILLLALGCGEVQ